MRTLTFIVGAPADAFDGAFASAVSDELRKRYSFTAAAGERYESEPVNARGWGELQTLISNMMGAGAAPHLTSVDAYQTVYLPAEVPAIEHVTVANAADPLHVASLTALLADLNSFASHAQLPTDDVELMQMAAQYLEDENGVDRELDFQMYVQLMLSAKQALARKQALWVVS